MRWVASLLVVATLSGCILPGRARWVAYSIDGTIAAGSATIAVASVIEGQGGSGFNPIPAAMVLPFCVSVLLGYLTYRMHEKDLRAAAAAKQRAADNVIRPVP